MVEKQKGEKERGEVTGVRVPTARGEGVNGCDVEGAPEGVGGVDRVRKGLAETMVVTERSISSSISCRARTERLSAMVTFGLRWNAQFCSYLDKQRALVWATGQGRRRGGENGWLRTSVAPESKN
jgi:hypothetical protein